MSYIGKALIYTIFSSVSNTEENIIQKIQVVTIHGPAASGWV